jgi:hypothetical protein
LTDLDRFAVFDVGGFTFARLSDFAGIRFADFAAMRAVVALVLDFALADFPSSPSDIPISMPLAKVEKFCVS